MAAAPSLYRGRASMWMWLVHRATGVGIFFYLLIHVLDTSLVRVSPESYDQVIGSYKTPLFGLLETGIVGALVFHAFNGLRVIAIDAWSWAARRQRLLTWIVLAIWVLLMAGFLPRHLANVFGGSE